MWVLVFVRRNRCEYVFSLSLNGSIYYRKKYFAVVTKTSASSRLSRVERRLLASGCCFFFSILYIISPDVDGGIRCNRLANFFKNKKLLVCFLFITYSNYYLGTYALILIQQIQWTKKNNICNWRKWLYWLEGNIYIGFLSQSFSSKVQLITNNTKRLKVKRVRELLSFKNLLFINRN